MKQLQRLSQAELAFAEDRRISTELLTDFFPLREKIPAETTADRMALWIAAPVLAAFMLWAKDQAKRPEALFLGVMREGRLLARLMQKLFGTEAKEIWANRHISMRAAFGAGDDEALLNWLVRTRMVPLPLRDAYRQLLGEDGPASDETLDLARAQTLMQEWAADGRLERARVRAQKLGAGLLRHWDSVVPRETETVFLMDFACAGNIQRSLRALLINEKRRDPQVGLNFATTAGVSWAQGRGCDIRGFLCDAGAPSWTSAAVARTPELMEIFTAAPLGSLTDYAEDGAPVVASGFLNEAQKKWALETQDKIVEAAALYAMEGGAFLTPDLARCLWGRLLRNPFKEEAEAVGDWPLDAGLDGKAQRKLAPPLFDPELLSDKKLTAWPVASQLR